jgi:hypothetical protein
MLEVEQLTEAHFIQKKLLTEAQQPGRPMALMQIVLNNRTATWYERTFHSNVVCQGWSR